MKERIERFSQYMKYKGLNDNQVTIQCGLGVGVIGGAKRGKSDLGQKTIEKILEKYQDLNRVWLLTGEGSMLIGDISGDSNAIGHGASVSNSNDSKIVEKLLDEISEQRKLVSESQRQVDRLLSIVEKMTSNL